MKRNAIRSLVVMLIAVIVFAFTPVPVSAATKAPARVKISSVKVSNVLTYNNTCTMTIKWKTAKRAKGYVIYMRSGNESWKKVKKVGRLYRKLKVRNTPCGQIQVKIQAINKKKKGKFSAVRTKFTPSKTTFGYYANYINTRYLSKLEKNAKDNGFITSVSGNVLTFTDDLAADGYTLADSDIAKLEPEANADLAKRNASAQAIKNEIKIDTGISVRVVFRYMYGTKTVASKTF